MRVAAYCRVSTDNEEQASSYESQIQHYTEYINSKPEWEMVRVYADEGISGTSTAHRDGFNQMIEDIKLAANGACPVEFCGRTGGMVPTPAEILEAIRKVK